MQVLKEERCVPIKRPNIEGGAITSSLCFDLCQRPGDLAGTFYEKLRYRAERAVFQRNDPEDGPQPVQ
jgi:hypothetical protein